MLFNIIAYFMLNYKYMDIIIYLPTLKSQNRFTNHRWAYNGYREEIRKEVMPQLLAAGKPISDVLKVKYKFHKKGRLFDLTNYSTTIKIIEDCLVDAGIIKDDRDAFVKEVSISQVKSPDNFVEITLQRYS